MNAVELSRLLGEIRERMGRFHGAVVFWKNVTQQIVNLHQKRRRHRKDSEEFATVNHDDIQKVLDTGTILSGSENAVPQGWEALIEGTTYDAAGLRVQVLLRKDQNVPVQVTNFALTKG